MQNHQKQFLELALKHNALRFGQFTLKSGRTSPYFFNAGQFHTGQALAALGRCYAETILASGCQFDVLFGPAYKGIPLVSAIAIAMAEHYDLDIPYCFNRKEMKGHGEGGLLIGAPLTGRVLIVDDVITAGTAISDVMDLFSHQPGITLAGVVVGLDRQEKSHDNLSATQHISQKYNVAVHAVANLDSLVTYLRGATYPPDTLAAIEAYRETHGC